MSFRETSIVAFASLLLLGGCGSGDLTLDQADPDAVARDPSFEQVFAIIQRDCVPCHGGGGGEATSASRAANRADVSPGLSTCELVVEYRRDILSEVRAGTMPTGAWPRLTSEEKLIIERWVENGAQAPCR